ncbi:hypothetical protein V6N11_000124 [Hibiscus sabdariffa]|uniref:Uncharacterized protein n=2 Tax=Hibiscus sabdariffa TaxID=183260 RepID=A0ABR2B5Z6_9ROSI
MMIGEGGQSIVADILCQNGALFGQRGHCLLATVIWTLSLHNTITQQIFVGLSIHSFWRNRIHQGDKLQSIRQEYSQEIYSFIFFEIKEKSERGLE